MQPDAFVRCGPTRPPATTVEDPVVVEVLAPGTVIHDLTRRPITGQGIPGLAVVLRVHPERMRADLVRRGGPRPAGRGAAAGAVREMPRPPAGVRPSREH